MQNGVFAAAVVTALSVHKLATKDSGTATFWWHAALLAMVAGVMLA